MTKNKKKASPLDEDAKRKMLFRAIVRGFEIKKKDKKNSQEGSDIGNSLEKVQANSRNAGVNKKKKSFYRKLSKT